jgi:aminopeptidase N
MVRFDEGNNLIKEWTFEKTKEELLYQLEFDDVIGRMWAASQLIPHHADGRVRVALVERAQEDPHWAVRRDVLYFLGGYEGVTQMDRDRGNIPWARLNEGFGPGRFLSEKLIDVFKGMDKDKNSKVRAAALWSLGNLRTKALIPYFQERFQRDDSYRAQAAALVAVGKSGDPAAASWLEKAGRMESPTNILRSAADWALKELKHGDRQ